MPRTIARSTPPLDSLTAAAYEVPKGDRQGVQRMAWQDEAWAFYDTTGELRYASAWFANAVSRATLIASKPDKDDVLRPVEDENVKTIVNNLFGGPVRQTQMLHALGLHRFMVGESYIIGSDRGTEEQWRVVAGQAVGSLGKNSWFILEGDGKRTPIPAKDAIIRSYRPHPRFHSQADSPVRSALPILREIALLNQHIGAQARSRLAGAGLLIVPSEVSFAAPTSQAAQHTLNMIGGAVDPFMASLTATMMASISDPGDPSALAPIIVKVPGEYVDKVRHLTFWDDLDQQAINQRDNAMRRLALSLDLPPEILLGTGNVNHWGAWQIEDSTIKTHIEPALADIAADLTQAVLRKVLDDPKVVLTFDTSKLRLRSDHSREAIELFDRGEISPEAMRRETGFSEKDKPGEEDYRRWLLSNLASGKASGSPEQIDAALQLLGVELPMPEYDPAIDPSIGREPDGQTGDRVGPGDPRDGDGDGIINEGRRSRGPMPRRSLDGHPNRTAPERPDRPRRRGYSDETQERASLSATCDALVWRALERAGNRLKNSTQSRPQGIASEDLYLHIKASSDEVGKLLDGAWTPLPRLVEDVGVAHSALSRNLDAYVKSLLTTQTPHSREKMMAFVDASFEDHS